MKIGLTVFLSSQQLIKDLGGIVHAYEHSKCMMKREPWNSHWVKVVRYLAITINKKGKK